MPNARRLAAAATLLLTACSDTSDPIAPATAPVVANPVALIDAGTVCDGTGVTVQECDGLVALYNATNGASWTNATNWGVNNNPCTWYGITCTLPLSGHVRVIDLYGNGLDGPIPASIGALTWLQELQLSQNTLGGTIPPVLGSLTALESLRLENTKLTGSIPAALGALPSLRILNLNSNFLSGSIPSELGNVVTLESLTLTINQLTGSIPASLGNLTSLGYLSLGSNDLTGPIPASFGNLTQLHAITLRDNALSGSLPASLGNLTALEYLELQRNDLTGSIPASFAQLASLRYMLLDGNALTGEIPAALGALPSLTVVNLHGNLLSGVLPLAVAAWDGLQVECTMTPGNEWVLVPDLPAYRALDHDADGTICGRPFVTVEDVEDDAVEDIEDLVPGTLNGGQGNALLTKFNQAVEKATAGQYQVAINLMTAFIQQVTDMMNNGTLTPAQGTPLVQQGQFLIVAWTAQL